MESTEALQLRLLAKESPRTLMLGVLSAWLLATAMWEGLRTAEYAWRAFGWAAAISLAFLRGMGIARRAVASVALDDLRRECGHLWRNGVVVAVLWGLSSFVLLPAGGFEHEVILVVAISLIVAGGSIGRAVHMPRLHLMILLSTSVFAVGLILQPGSFHRFIGLGYLLFGPVIAFFTRAQENLLQRERDLTREIQHLLHDADQARLAAERASAAKTRFLASASHDLRQPMHSIGLLVGVLHDRLCDPAMQGSPAQGLRDLSAKALMSVETMQALFGSLLDLSTLEAGAVRPECHPVLLHELLDDVAQVWLPQAEAARLDLRWRLRPITVVSDPDLLRRIAHNLVANAIRYTPPGGRVLLVCRRRAGQAVLQVWDNGIGIAPELQEVIFEEFFRIDAARHANHKGLGLGLSIVSRTARLLGHEVTVRSRPGAGSRFEVAMPPGNDPQLDELTGAPLPDRADANGLAGSFVVIVDDDEQNRDAIGAVFLSQGCHILTAPNLAQAIAESARHLRGPDLLVVDGQLGPGGDGIHTLEQLRAHHGENIPALIVTADMDSAWASRAASRRAQLLHKPVAVRSLLEAAARALSVRPQDVVP